MDIRSLIFLLSVVGDGGTPHRGCRVRLEVAAAAKTESGAAVLVQHLIIPEPQHAKPLIFE
jgi:hypothetical protein